MTASLFPVEVDKEIPKLSSSADCASFCIGIDSNTYAVKKLTDNPDYPFTPFDEFFCYELAKRCQIAVPSYNILQMADGTLGFGSIWEGGLLEQGFIVVLKDFLSGSHSIIEKDSLLRTLSAIFILDMFVSNEDRHTGNYLIKHNGDIVNTHSLLAMDYGRSFTSVRFPIDLAGNIANSDRYPINYLSPPHPNTGDISNTYKVASYLWAPKVLGPLSGKAVFRVLKILEDLTSSNIEYILRNAPDTWCTPQRKQKICEWWESDLRLQRVNELKLRYVHGTLV